MNYKREKDSYIHLQNHIDSLINLSPKQYRQRFLIRFSGRFQVVNTSDILYFFIEGNNVFFTDINRKIYALEYTLDKVYELVNPEDFFRINRKYIVSLNSIEKMISYSQYRIKLNLKNCGDDDIIVSRERVKSFKSWLER